MIDLRELPNMQTGSSTSVVWQSRERFGPPETMTSYRAPFRADNVERVRLAMRADADGDESLSDELIEEFSIFDTGLLDVVVDPTAREDIRAFAAKLWIRTLYPLLDEDVTVPTRRQTAYALPVTLKMVIGAVILISPPLVKLGFLAGLDEVADFEFVRELLRLESDALFASEAGEILAEVA